MEENVKLDLDNNEELVEVNTKKTRASKKPMPTNTEPEELYNCLKNERVIVRYVPKQSGSITNPKHVLYGGMAENATRTFTVPKLSSSGAFVNILTDKEKAYLEYIMGLEHNTLSIYKKENNFWDDSNPNGINKVKLHKQDNYLDLSNPEDYIKYKILLANKTQIAPSIKDLTDKPKATYQFVLISEGEEIKTARQGMSVTMECYREFGKIEDKKQLLRVIVETLDGRPTATNSKLEFLQTKINELIQANPKTFLQVIKDPLIETKALIKSCLEAGYISKRGEYYYLRKDGSPLCGMNEEPTLTIAAKYLNLPQNQELKFSLEANIK